ncbi:protein NRT1/ PTR FAMILY 4.3 isoform X2 [Zea mays]|uniref:protein NRT1/ PTR FAMILY 4.3 isoform X2 n=1 Tax=Zea mays TaxID=4577 RepID=UPI0009A9E5CA|nr:protein NRT1/ PTR FAMILY 4.3 isoform X2 [Zea mays]|eukprot:XP_020401177.1 protein NRT1/ PTR FAMILY 4.3 isoform X2 [Zea mays]
MEGEQVYVDWRGNAADERRHGGVRATVFLYVLFMLRSCSNSSNFTVVAYLHGTLHLDIVTSSTVIGYLVGTVMISAALMNFISDACMIKRTTAIFVFGPCVILGYMLLALQAHFPALHPETCAIDEEPNSCEAARGWKLTLLYLGLFMFAVGEGCMRACVPSLGGDQFSDSDPKKPQLRRLLVAASGCPFYRMQKPSGCGSPLTRTLQVLITSSNQKSAANVDDIELQDTNTQGHVFKSGTNQADETRVLIQMLPIFISCFLVYLPFVLLMTLTIQVGRAMDRGAGAIQIPSAASLIAIPTAFHTLMQPCYDRILTPLLRTATGHQHGATPLQRIGAGSACGIAAACVAALVEARRLNVAEQRGLTTSTGTGVPALSVFWLVIQFFLLSVMDTASFGGLAEFIRSEAPSAMKSIAPAVQSCVAGLAAWSCCAFIHLVNRMTRSGGGGDGGWLDGTDFNRARLDRFFLSLGAFELLALVNYTFWARRYARKLRRVSTVV